MAAKLAKRQTSTGEAVLARTAMFAKAKYEEQKQNAFVGCGEFMYDGIANLIERGIVELHGLLDENERIPANDPDRLLAIRNLLVQTAGLAWALDELAECAR